MDERARNGDALHLAAGELVWKAIAEAIEFNHLRRSRRLRELPFSARSSGSSTFSKTGQRCSS